MPSKPITAVVADDSHFMRSVISDILDEGGISVVAQARNGDEAVELVMEHKPDVVTMDVEMPKMNGIEAADRIMANEPTPVLMLSAHTEDDAEVTFSALDAGAVDFFTKPGGEVSMEMSRLKDQLVEMVRSVATTDVTDSAGSGQQMAVPEPTIDRAYVDNPTIIIGSSTGGPKEVERILSKLPDDGRFRVLIVQHMPKGFTGRFADRIDARSEYDVREASHGARIGGGEALVARGGHHLLVSNYSDGRLRVKLSDDPPVNSVKPSVDVTMISAAEIVDDPLIGVILTGMGHDGAKGMQAIKAAGGTCIAQDEETSAVFGMPDRAIETGAIDEVLPIHEMLDGILDAARIREEH